jgi:hypothetical protein
MWTEAGIAETEQVLVKFVVAQELLCPPAIVAMVAARSVRALALAAASSSPRRPLLRKESRRRKSEFAGKGTVLRFARSAE